MRISHFTDSIFADVTIMPTIHCTIGLGLILFAVSRSSAKTAKIGPVENFRYTDTAGRYDFYQEYIILYSCFYGMVYCGTSEQGTRLRQ